MWSDPDQGNAGMFGPFGNVRANGDGLTLTGRWPFCSNSLHSAWIGLGAFWFGDADEAEPIPRLVLVPMDDVTVEPTWDAPGLCATGSHHASVDGAVVERERSVSFVDPPWAEGPLWRLPLFCLLAPGLGIAPLGIARGALDEIAAAIEGKVGGTRGSLADDPVGLADFAEADTALRGARAGLLDACNRAWDCAERGERVPKVLQAQVMLAMNYGCQVAVDVTSMAHRLGGGRAAYADSSLLRRLRDVQTARQHIMFGQSQPPDVRQDPGRRGHLRPALHRLVGEQRVDGLALVGGQHRVRLVVREDPEDPGDDPPLAALPLGVVHAERVAVGLAGVRREQVPGDDRVDGGVAHAAGAPVDHRAQPAVLARAG